MSALLRHKMQSPDSILQQRITYMFRFGWSTAGIAKRLNITEAKAYNLLAKRGQRK